MDLRPVLKPVQKFLLDNPPTLYHSARVTKTPVYMPNNAYDLDTAVLRLDSEVRWGGIQFDWEWDDVVPLVIGQIEGDLIDLIKHGDRDGLDPLLKAFDGVEKRGIEPVGATVDDLVLYRYDVPKKSATELTVYLRLHVDWPQV